MSLEEAYAALARALAPLGIEPDKRVVLAIWHDRRRFGNDPLPAEALRILADVAEILHQERLAATADQAPRV